MNGRPLVARNRWFPFLWSMVFVAAFGFVACACDAGTIFPANQADQSSPVECVGSYVGCAVSESISNYEQERGLGLSLSRLTTNNQLPKDFLVDNKQRFIESVIGEIGSAKSRLRLSSYAFDEQAALVLAKGLRRLHENTCSDERFLMEHDLACRYPLVQVLYSVAEMPGSYGPRDILQSVREAMEGIPESEWHFYLAIRSMSFTPAPSANHTKIVVRDDEQGLVGGTNLADFTYYSDLVEHDVSMKISGEAARAARDVFDALWYRAVRDSSTFFWSCAAGKNFPAEYGCVDNKKPNVFDYADIAKTELVPALPRIDERPGPEVFALARGRVYAGPERQWSGDFSGDHAIIAALGSARFRLGIVQHSLIEPAFDPIAQELLEPFYQAQVPTSVKNAVLDAVFGRGVSVDIAISDAWPMSLSTADAQAVVEKLYDGAAQYAAKRWGIADQKLALDWLDCSLKVARYRAKGEPGAVNHAKFFLIDSQAFYVGSQNLYPSETLGDLSDESGTQLNDFGLLVDDAAVASLVERDYFLPIWNESEVNRVMPKGRSFDHCIK